MAQTVFVTGATGYIAKHIVLQLLDAGHNVIGSSRDAGRIDEMRAALAPHLADTAALDRLRIVPLDLTSDAGWDQAMGGADVLMHTASPFPLVMPRDENDLIRPAVDGALRAACAARAAGIRRVVMTSSSAAILDGTLPPGRNLHTEEDWSDLTQPGVTAYTKSKTLAERAVWDWQRDEAPEMQITTINPTLVMGAPLDRHYGTSGRIVERLLRGKDPLLPRVGIPCVDIRDIALMHLRAMERPESIGHRVIGSDRFLWFSDMAQALQAEFPNRRIAKPLAPNLVVRALALFDPSIRSVLPSLGKRKDVLADKARQMLGIEFRDAREAIRQIGRFVAQAKAA